MRKYVLTFLSVLFALTATIASAQTTPDRRANLVHAAEQNFWLQHAYSEVNQTYGISAESKSKSLHKFGENLLVGTAEATVMTLPSGVTSESYVSTNAINRISSSNDGDDQSVVVEGHTIDGNGNLTFAVQTVTLTGQTAAELTTPLARVTRLYNADTTDWAGNIYVHELDATIDAGVPQATAKIHLIGPAGENQSLKASTAVSQGDVLLITELYASMNKKTAGYGVIRLRIRSQGGVFRTLFKRGVANGAELNMEFKPYIIVPPNSDIIITAEADNASTPIAAGFNSILLAVD